METLDTVVAAIEARYDGKAPRPVFYQTRSGIRIHLRHGCTGAKLRSSSAYLGKLKRDGCKTCSTPDTADTDAAQVVADALVHNVASSYLRRIRGGSGSLHFLDRTRTLEELADADLYAGGTHPDTETIRAQLPKPSDEIRGDSAYEQGLVLLAAASGDTGIDADDAKALIDADDAGAALWERLTNLVIGGVALEQATDLLMQSVTVDEPTIRMIPDELTGNRDDHPDTAAWLRAEWAAVVARARVRVPAAIRARIDAMRELDETGAAVIYRQAPIGATSNAAGTIGGYGRIHVFRPALHAAARRKWPHDTNWALADVSDETRDGLSRYPEALEVAATFSRDGMTGTIDDIVGAALLVMHPNHAAA